MDNSDAMTQITKAKRGRREALREELKSREYLRQIHNILESDWTGTDPAEHSTKLNAYFRLLNKTLPDAKDCPVKLKVDTSQPLFKQASSITSAVLKGEITPLEGKAVMDLLSKASSVRLDDDLEARIQKLEKEAAEDD